MSKFVLKMNPNVPINDDFVKNHPDLEILDLSNTDTVYFPKSICTLKNLRVIDITSTKITYLPPEIGEMEKMEELIIANTPLLTAEMYKAFNLSEPNELLRRFKLAATKEQAPKWFFPVYPPEVHVFSVFSWNMLASKCAQTKFFPLSLERSLNYVHRDILSFRLVNEIRPDIIALQEYEARQVGVWNKTLTDTDYYASFAPKGRYHTKRPEQQALVHGQVTLVNIRKFEVVTTNMLYPRLSKLNNPKDEEIDGCDDVVLLTAIRTRVRFPKNYVIVNIHMKYTSTKLRTRLAEIIMKEALNFSHQIFKHFGLIVLGDFNDISQSSTLKKFYDFKLTNVYDSQNVDPPTSNFQTVAGEHQRIDHILVSQNIKIKSLISQEPYKKIVELFPVVPCENYPSDHFPIGAVIEI